MVKIFKEQSYIQAKHKFIKWVERVRAIEKELNRKLLFEDGYFSMERIEKDPPAENTEIKILRSFVSVYNDFDKDSRTIIYYCFFRDTTNVAISQKLHISTTKLAKLKNEIIVDFVEQLEMELFLKAD